MVNMGVEPRTLALLAPRSKPTELIDREHHVIHEHMLDWYVQVAEAGDSAPAYRAKEEPKVYWRRPSIACKMRSNEREQLIIATLHALQPCTRP
jgi:hypothetical protein